MEPMTDILVGALISGVAEGLIGQAYNALVSAFRRKHGTNSDVINAVESLEKKPESKARQAVVAEEMDTVNAGADPELVRLANALLEAVKATPAGANVASSQINITGDGNVIGDNNTVQVNKSTTNVHGGQVGVIGDNAKVEGGINFGKN